MQQPSALRLSQVKRGRRYGPSYYTAVGAAGLYTVAPHDDREEHEDIWQNMSLFELDTVPNGPVQTGHILGSNKRSV